MIPKLSTLIKKQKFYYVNSNITDTLFNKPKEISSDYKLFHFDRYISSENAVKEMEKEGYRPANVWELLSWKDWNNKDFVIALGSVGEVDGNRSVPYLNGDVSWRSLSLRWWVNDWYAGYRFLGVRNSPEVSQSLESSVLEPLETLNLESRVKKIENWIRKEANFINPFD